MTTDTKNLVSFGCSWTYGDSCKNIERDSFRSILAEKYNLNQINLSMPGSSLLSMQWTLSWWLNKTDVNTVKQSFFLVGLTGEGRTSWYNPKHNKHQAIQPWDKCLHSTCMEWSYGDTIDSNWYDLNKYYYALSHSQELEKYNIDTTAIMFDAVASKYNIPILQFNTVATLKPKVDSFYDINIKDKLTELCYPKNDGHPNELGHKFIAKYLTETIETNKLLG